LVAENKGSTPLGMILSQFYPAPILRNNHPFPHTRCILLITNFQVAEPESSTPLVQKCTVRHNVQLVPSVSHCHNLFTKIHRHIYLQFPSLCSKCLSL